MMKIKPKPKFLKKEEMDAVKKVIRSEGEILREIEESNEGHEALWPEDQYVRRISDTP